MSKPTDIENRVPLLKEVRVATARMPLYYAHWRGLVDNALEIRQTISQPRDRGFGLTFSQHESVRRGVCTIWGRISAKWFLADKLSGTQEWLQKFCTAINLCIQGSKPIEKLQLVRTDKPHFLAYYASFYANYMEIIIYIDSGEDIDGADVDHLPRSKVDETTRNWKLLAEQLPLEVWIETETKRRA
jgi:hypothetical protein